MNFRNQLKVCAAVLCRRQSPQPSQLHSSMLWVCAFSWSQELLFVVHSERNLCGRLTQHMDPEPKLWCNLQKRKTTVLSLGMQSCVGRGNPKGLSTHPWGPPCSGWCIQGGMAILKVRWRSVLGTGMVLLCLWGQRPGIGGWWRALRRHWWALRSSTPEYTAVCPQRTHKQPDYWREKWRKDGGRMANLPNKPTRSIKGPIKCPWFRTKSKNEVTQLTPQCNDSLYPLGGALVSRFLFQDLGWRLSQLREHCHISQKSSHLLTVIFSQ